MTTSPPEPELVRIQGVNLLLYQSGIKRGHAEACEEQAATFKATAQKYREGASAMDSEDDTFRLTAIAELLDGFAGQMVATGAQARANADGYMARSVQAITRQNDAVAQADEMVATLRLRANRLTVRQRVLSWMSTRLAHLAG